MIDLTDFKRYKIVYLAIILSCSMLIAFLTAPSYPGAFVDISVEPPGNVRMTDFSWITVNEWFITQACLIKGDEILDGIKTDIGKEELKRDLSVGRLGAANIIRISISSNRDIGKSKKLVGDIANLYLSQLGKPDREDAGTSKMNEWRRKIEHGDLTGERAKIVDEIAAADKRFNDYEAKLKQLEARPEQLQQIKIRMASLDKELVGLKAQVVSLQAVYTDNWPAVINLRNNISAKEKERQLLESNLPVAQKTEVEKTGMISEIDKEKKNIQSLQGKINEIDSLLAEREERGAAVKDEEAAPSKEPAGNHIITAPTENKQRSGLMLGRRLLIAAIIGVVFWFFVGLIFKNAYLYWIVKDRLFTKR